MGPGEGEEPVQGPVEYEDGVAGRVCASELLQRLFVRLPQRARVPVCAPLSASA